MALMQVREASMKLGNMNSRGDGKVEYNICNFSEVHIPI